MNAKVLFAHWDQVRRDLLRAVDLINDDQLTFVPREGMWSLGDVLRHIANAEEGWFRYAVQRELPEWPKHPAEDFPTIESIKTLLAEVHARTDATLEGIAIGDVDQVIDTPSGEQIPLRWIIWHVLEHEIHHRGEVYLMLGRLGLEGPDI